jgi:plasmid maintenance system antidote protein VapI
VRLGKFVGDGPDVWARMQAAHDVAKARIVLAKEVKKIPTAHAT